MYSRRSFLRALISVSLLRLVRPSDGLAQLDKSPGLDPLALSLARSFTYRESAKVIGSEYLRRVPQEANTRLLIDLICSCSAERRTELRQADVGTARRLLQLQQREDFEYGRIVNLQGWILSQTEVRLCALTALMRTCPLL